nr:class I SAM-dependent methyltransferase [Fimbriiglobus ruber]
MFAETKPERLLDYGGGNGRLAELLRAAGFPRVETYDPFVPRFATKPTERFDCIVSIEMVEHSTDPVGTFAEMNDLLTEPGLILFSTLLQPNDLDRRGLSWWYVGPRNGPVSLYTKAALDAIGRRFGLTRHSFDNNHHAFYRVLPAFAESFIRADVTVEDSR